MKRRTVLAGFAGAFATWHARGFATSHSVFAQAPSGAASVVPLTLADLEQLRRDAGAPALAVTAARRQLSPQKWVVGKRAIDADVAATENDLWHWGSNTKPMTATLVARLVESGAVSWNETIGNLLRQAAPDMNAAYAPVTLLHLLSHRSGLPANITLEQLALFANSTDEIKQQRREFSRIALRAPPVGPMESTFEYSNSGYVIAAAMLEAKLGRSWEELIRTHLFDPLNMRSAGFGPPIGRDRLSQPLGHFVDGGVLTPIVHDNPPVLGPAGRVHMSLADMLTFVRAHCDQAPFLNAASWRTLHEAPYPGEYPFDGEYALGWLVLNNGLIWHNGSNSLWYAEIQFDSASGVIAAAVANDGRPGAQAAVGQALNRAAASV